MALKLFRVTSSTTLTVGCEILVLSHFSSFRQRETDFGV